MTSIFEIIKITVFVLAFGVSFYVLILTFVRLGQ